MVADCRADRFDTPRRQRWTRWVRGVPSRALLAFGLLGLAGCAAEPDAGVQVEGSPQATSTAQSSSDYEPVATTLDWSEEVRLVPVTHDQWTRELDALAGEIVVVDYWATWCVPCRERFPHMVSMAKRFGPQGVRFVSLSLDDRDDPVTTGEVTEFLQSQDSRMPNYLMDEIIPDAFEKLDLLGIPAVAIYNREGELHAKLTGDNPNRQFTEEDVETAVLELIDEIEIEN